MIFDNSHPILHIQDLLKSLPIMELEFSIYEYQPKSILDKRKILKINSEDLSTEWLDSVVSNLDANEELAFHSKVKVKKRYYHIPMIDFSCPTDELQSAKRELRKVLDPFILNGFRYYNSGRSVHAYGSSLLNTKDWHEFMGALLLANIPPEQNIIDSRWIGHRLIGGFSSLRWTSNSCHYLGVPSLIKTE